MNFFDSDRLYTGAVVISRLTTPPLAPLIVTMVLRDIPAKKCIVHVRDGARVRTMALEDVDWIPALGKWDAEKCAWFDRNSGEQLLPKAEAAA